MTKEQVNRMLKTQPFRPFGIRLADGKVVPVKHPEFAALSPGGRTMIVYTGDEAFEVIDVFLVTALETVNGKAHRPRAKGRR